MGFFKKIFKGIKKVFKKIGKAVKSAFKKVGKFMGKIGIVGQLGLALIMPYALPALGGLATGMMGTQLGGVLGAAVKGAGHFLNAAVKLGTRVGTAFKSVTKAVTDTIGNMVGATVNQIPGAGDFLKGISGGKIDITNKTFSSAWEATQNAWSNAGDSLGNLFSKSTFDSSMNKFGLDKMSPPSAVISEGEMLIDASPVQQEGAFAALAPEQTGALASPVGTTGSTIVEGGGIKLQPGDAITQTTPESLLGAPVTEVAPMSKAAQLGARSKEFLKGQGVELTTAGAITMAQDYLDAESAEAQAQRLKDPFAFVDMSYLTPQPIQSSPGLSTAGLTPMSGWDYFNQIQDDILNSNFNNIYSQGYYGSPSLQAGLAMAYQELNQ
jgi:hypothetical protein